MLELPGGHNEVGFADESLSRALRQFWSNPGLINSPAHLAGLTTSVAGNAAAVATQLRTIDVPAAHLDRPWHTSGGSKRYSDGPQGPSQPEIEN
jgi:hypothetical protein